MTTPRPAGRTTSALCASLLILAQLAVLVSLAPLAAAGPVVTGVAPTSGSTNGGTSITVTGTGFVSGAHVTVGGTAATSIAVGSATTLTFVSPPHAAGAVDVIVTNSDGQATTFTNGFTYSAAAAPTITSIAPASGTANGGTTVTIAGTNFVAGATVVIGGSKATVIAVASNAISAETTGHAGGAATVSVVVTNPDGLSPATLTNGFAYSTAAVPTLTTLSATSGPSNGGTSVVLTGTNLAPGALVSFGGTLAASVTYSSSTSITAVTPAKAAASAAVLITNPDGQTTSATPATFSFVAPLPAEKPTVTAVLAVGSTATPATGSTLGGTTLSITGTNFHTGSNAKPVVRLSDTADCPTLVTTFPVADADVTVTSSTSLTVKTPAGTGTALRVCVFNPTYAVAVDANALGQLNGAFTYVAPVRLDSISASTGPSAGGTSLTFTGAGFPASGPGAVAPTIRFGGVLVPVADITLGTATTITSVLAPPHAVGTVTIEVVLANGVGTTLSGAYTYTASAAPVLTSASPTTGNTNGGTVVTLTGTGFQVDADFLPTVTVGGVAALVCTAAGFAGTTAITGCAAPTSVSLKIVSPARTSSAVAANQAIRVTNADGQTVVSDATDNSDDFDYTAATAPAITALSGACITTPPCSTNGGDTILITGSAFHAVANQKPTVTVGGTAVLPAAVTVATSSSITIVTPAHAAGTALDVFVTNPDAQATPQPTPATANDLAIVAASAPTVTGLSSTSGSANGGTILTITGTNFGPVTAAGAPTVTIGGNVATVCTSAGFVGTVAVTGCGTPSATSLSIIIPGHAPGLVSVVVTNQDAQTVTFTSSYTYSPFGAAPTLTAISSATGSATGGYFLALTGTGFPGAPPGLAPTVTVGGTSATVCTGTDLAGYTTVTGCVAPVSTTQVTIRVPVHAAGTATIVLSNPDGQSASLGNSFRYIVAAPTIASISPVSGSANGGTALTITGTGFDTSVKPTTLVDSTVALIGTVTATTIAATAPVHAVGVVNLVAIDADGQTATLKGGYTYTFAQALAFTSIAPAAGSVNGGTTVTIVGNGFAPGATVAFDSATATVTSAANGQLVFVTPNVAKFTTAGDRRLGPHTVVITNPDGQALTLTDKFAFTAVAGPVVSSVNPTTGPAAGGTSITITGSNFASGATVTVGGAACTTPVVTGTTSITCTTPSGAAGAVAIAVTVAGQTGSLANAFTYTGTGPAPTITAISPTSGLIAGGTSVTLTGTNFASGATVKFDTSDCTAVAVTGTTSITCTTPAHAAGAVTVTVTVGTQTATTTYTYTTTTSTTSSTTSSTTTTTSTTGTSTSSTGTVSPSTINTLNGQIVTKVTRDGSTNVISWTLPTTGLPQAVAGVQVFRSNSPYVLVASFDAGTTAYNAGTYTDSSTQALETSKYLVTMFFGKTAALGFKDSSNLPDTADFPGTAVGTTSSTSSGLPAYAIALIVAAVVLLAVLVIVLVVRSRRTAPTVAWEDPQQAAGWTNEQAVAPEASAETHTLQCPACATQFTATGSKPLTTTCPGCNRTGILR